MRWRRREVEVGFQGGRRVLQVVDFVGWRWLAGTVVHLVCAALRHPCARWRGVHRVIDAATRFIDRGQRIVVEVEVDGTVAAMLFPDSHAGPSSGHREDR